MSFFNLISENLILPISDIFTGQSVYKSFSFLKKTQFWTREQIDDFQNKKLQELIRHANDTVPYYKDLFNDLKFDIREIQTKNDLNKLPLLRKEIIKEEGIERFTSSLFDKKKLILRSSSGSTGEPLYYYINKAAYSMNIAANLRGWYNMGYRLGDKFVKLSQNPRKSKLKKLQDIVTRNLYLPVNALEDEDLDLILQKIEKYRPKIIRCYPDPLLILARYKQKKRYTYTPQVINCTGSTLRPEMREEIESAFGCKIFDSYSCEGNPCVFECATHEAYHSAEEYGISEILNEEGKYITSGVGRLISTDLWNWAQPFIRYDTQDLLEIDGNNCNCGKISMKVNRIAGRYNEILVMPNGKKYTFHHFTTFFSSRNIHVNRAINQFQIIQKPDSSIVFRVIANNHYDNTIKDYIVDFWAKEFGEKVTIELVDNIPLTKSGKRKFIIREEVLDKNLV